MTTELEKQQPGELTELQIIDRMGSDPSVSVEKYTAAWELRQRVLEHKARVEFLAAMARVQSRAPRINKKGAIVVPAKPGTPGRERERATPYALYEDIDSGIRPIYQEEGFSLCFSSETVAGGGAIWRCAVSHRLGHQETFSTPALPADTTGSKNNLQAIFSTSTYAKRYLTCLIFNIVTVGVDDDGKAHGYLTEDQVLTISTMLNDAKIAAGSERMEKFLLYAAADSVAHIQQGMYSRCVLALRPRAGQ